MTALFSWHPARSILSLFGLPQRRRMVLISAVAAAIVITSACTAWALTDSHRRAQARAATSALTLATSLQLAFESAIAATDRQLQESAEEAAHRLSAPRLDLKSLARTLEHLAPHVGGATSLRVYDEAGDLVWTSVASASNTNVSKREFFARARNHSDAKTGFLANATPDPTYARYSWPLVRRLSGPDGSFRGILLATLDTDAMAAMLRQVGMRRGDALELRDAAFALVARTVFEGGAATAPIAVGDRRSCVPALVAMTANPEQGSFVSDAAYVDPAIRTYAYRRSPGYGFMVLAGTPQETVLDAWREQAVFVLALLGTFIAASLAFALIITRGWRRQESALERIRNTEHSLREVVEIARLGVLVYDLRGETWTSSEAFDAMMGIDASYPRDMINWLRLFSADLRDEVRVQLNGLIERDVPFDMECRIVRPGDGQERWVHCACRGRHDKRGNPTAIVSTYQDITSRKAAEETITKLAFFDQLTGLANRTLLLDRLQQAMGLTARNGQYGAIMLIDLDNFKSLNDIHGHEKGDLLLKQVAHRLTRCMRAEDTIARLVDKNTVARLGGDEFVVVVSNLRGGGEEDAAKQAKIVASKVLLTLNQTYALDGVDFVGTASIGVTLFRGRQVSIEDLLKQADLAMYRAKASGRDAVCFFDAALQATLMQRATLEGHLRRALDPSLNLNQFLLHYQAQVNGDGHVTGAEVLVRWQHPVLGMVSPGEFIPVAEDSNLILPMGKWVLETACRQLSAWAARPEFAHLTVAVNVSAHQFYQADFVDQVRAILEDSKAHPHLLKLELTESLLLRDIDEIIRKMMELKAIGVGFALDDFGTGYSSLMYLKRLPLDQLKIDQSFVRDVLIDPNSAAIARTVAALGQTLGLRVIAEGVESRAQLDFLARSGVHAYQGFYFSRPLPLEGFEAFALREWERENRLFVSQVTPAI
jgi:diguanylate cyclase (GGDEF)-like protein/PAS domain S-box-containing protein